MRKQRLWKKVSGVLAAAMVLCAVSGCSKEAAESPEVSEPSKARKRRRERKRRKERKRRQRRKLPGSRSCH